MSDSYSTQRTQNKGECSQHLSKGEGEPGKGVDENDDYRWEYGEFLFVVKETSKSGSNNPN